MITFRLRRWLPGLLLVAVVAASRLKVPAAQSTAVQLQVAAECGFVPGGQAMAALPGPHPSPQECMRLAKRTLATSSTLGGRVLAEARHQWAVFRADSAARGSQ